MKFHKSITIEERGGCGDVFVNIVGKGKKVFVYGGKDGTCMNTWLDTISCLINKLIECGVTIQEIRGMLNNRVCPRMRKVNNRWCYSCIDAIAHGLEDYEDLK